jgi:flagellar basal-body rod modification protein FlgD
MTTVNAAGSTTAPASSLFGTPNNLGKDDFLKLLVTQLRFQDPMAPQDPKDFVTQLAQFSSLEQQINSNTNLLALGRLVNHLSYSLLMSRGVGLLGKTVKAMGNSLTVSGGNQVGASYELPRDAKQVTVNIYNASGQLVRTLELGGQAAGMRQFTWDGKDADGKPVADGTYTFKVTALDSQGQTMEASTYITGKVTEVYWDEEGVWVKVDGRPVLVDNIVSVVQS